MKDTRKSYTLRTSDEVMKWLKEKAKKNERSLNFVLGKVLESAKRREEEELI